MPTKEDAMTTRTELKSNPDSLTKGVIPYLQVEGAAKAVAVSPTTREMRAP